MGMSNDGDELQRIPAHLLSELKDGEPLDHQIGHLTRMLEERDDEPRPPVFAVGQEIEFNGVRFEVMGIQPRCLSLRPIGWAIEQK
jgi:hypothetical protein